MLDVRAKWGREGGQEVCYLLFPKRRLPPNKQPRFHTIMKFIRHHKCTYLQVVVPPRLPSQTVRDIEAFVWQLERLVDF